MAYLLISHHHFHLSKDMIKATVKKPVSSTRLYLGIIILLDIYHPYMSVLLLLSLHAYVCMLRLHWHDWDLALALIH